MEYPNLCLHVARIAPDVQPTDLEQFLRDSFPEVVCESLQSKHPQIYSSFKVKIVATHYEKAMNPALWPINAQVRRFFHPITEITNHRITAENYLVFSHVNVQCLRNKLTETEAFISSVSAGVFCVSEHWASDEELDSLALENFTIMSRFCRRQQIHGGSAIFVRNDVINDYKFRDFDVTRFCSEVNIELRCCVFALNCLKVYVLTVYRLPLGNVQSSFVQLNSCLNYITRKKYNIILCGDFNIGLMSSHLNTKILRYLLNSYNIHVGLVAIDYMLTDLAIHGCTLNILDPFIADHFAHILKVDLSTVVSPMDGCAQGEMYRRETFQSNMIILKELIEMTDWALMMRTSRLLPLLRLC